MAQASIAKLSESLGIDDSVPRTLQDKLGLREAAELADWSPRVLSTLFPDLDRGMLYEMGKAVAPAQAPEPAPPQEEGSSFTIAGDEFNNGPILNSLPRYDAKVDNQGDKNGSCTAFATSLMLDFYLARTGRPNTRVSRAFLYLFGNQHEGQHLPWWSPFGIIPYNDIGVWPDTMSRVVPSMGFCFADQLPYDAGHLYYEAKSNPARLVPHPDPRLRLQASHVQQAKANVPRGNFKVWTLFPNPLDWVTSRIDNSLRAGFPVPYALKTPADLSGGGTGVMPRRDGDNGTGHSVLIIGKKVNYTPPGQPTGNWYIYRNSWGPDFGANHPLAEYRGQCCGLLHEHDVYWRHIQALFMTW